MRIAIANASICSGKGGSERAAIRLARELVKRGHEAHILTVQTTLPPLYDMDPRVPVHFFPDAAFRGETSALRHGDEVIRNMDALVSFESNWLHALWGDACDRAGTPHVVSERITPMLIENEFWNRQARRELLATRAAVHELLPGYLEFIPDTVKAKTFVIPNAAPENLPDQFPAREPSQKTLLFLGRFSREKRPGLLLDAFSILANEFPDWSLKFAGWGEKQDVLEKKRDRLGLASRVQIRMAQRDVAREYLAASLYCLPTLHEGFPNTVLEAMGYGLPVVGTGDCIAMRSIIRPGFNGLLSGDGKPEALADALRPLLASREERLRMGKNAWRDARENYSPELFDKWEKELKKVAKKS